MSIWQVAMNLETMTELLRNFARLLIFLIYKIYNGPL